MVVSYILVCLRECLGQHYLNLSILDVHRRELAKNVYRPEIFFLVDGVPFKLSDHGKHFFDSLGNYKNNVMIGKS